MSDERDVAPLTLEIRVGTGFEALAAASVLVGGANGVTWPHRLAGPLAAPIIELTGDSTGELWLHLFAAATDLPGEPDLTEVAGWLAAQDPGQLRRVVIGADVPAWRQVVPDGLLDAAAEGRPDAVAAMLADKRHYAGAAAAALVVLAPLDPAEIQRRLVAAFERLRRAIPPRLEAELGAAQRAFVRDHVPTDRSDPLAVLDAAAGGFAWTPEIGVRRLVLVPHLAAAPGLLLLQHRDARVVGVAADDQESPASLSTAYAALGDEQRLRILQLLNHRELGVSEVARELGIAKSTAHHHLAALRQAGLIRLAGQAWRYAYRARDDGPDRLATRLRLLLATPPHLEEEP